MLNFARFKLGAACAFLVLAGLAAWRGRSLGAVTFTAFGSALVAMALLAPGRLGRRLRGAGKVLGIVLEPLMGGHLAAEVPGIVVNPRRHDDSPFGSAKVRTRPP